MLRCNGLAETVGWLPDSHADLQLPQDLNSTFVLLADGESRLGWAATFSFLLGLAELRHLVRADRGLLHGRPVLARPVRPVGGVPWLPRLGHDYAVLEPVKPVRLVRPLPAQVERPPYLIAQIVQRPAHTTLSSLAGLERGGAEALLGSSAKQAGMVSGYYYRVGKPTA